MRGAWAKTTSLQIVRSWSRFKLWCVRVNFRDDQSPFVVPFWFKYEQRAAQFSLAFAGKTPVTEHVFYELNSPKEVDARPPDPDTAVPQQP